MSDIHRERRRSTHRLSGMAVAVLATTPLASAAHAAGPCQTAMEVTATGNYAAAWGPAIFNFTQCTGMASGAASECGIWDSPSTFTAKWTSTDARTGDAVGGCVFTCPGGSCRIGNDGLPVELLGFAIE